MKFAIRVAALCVMVWFSWEAFAHIEEPGVSIDYISCILGGAGMSVFILSFRNTGEEE